MAHVAAAGGGAALMGWAMGSSAVQQEKAAPPAPRVTIDYSKPIARRPEQIARLAKGTKDSPFDLLIIGGGATGTGIAVDAVTRGLSTALVEREDFASGTSSRSTKLVHGGVRYLETAVFGMDYGQLKLVYEALAERKNILENAAYLANALPIMTPCWSWWEVVYYWAGMKAYDLVAMGGKGTLQPSKFCSRQDAVRSFPTLATENSDGQSLKGTIVYYDGQFNDARMSVALACTAACGGGTIANHTEAVGLIKDTDGQVTGATVKDLETGKKFDVHAKVVINATGPFVDAIRCMSDSKAPRMVTPSSGVHLVMPDYYSAQGHGLIVPRTKDGRVLFVLPWMQHTIIGTTDAETKLTMRPKPTEKEINFILDEVKNLLTVKVRREDVLSAWSGIRPLATDPTANPEDTASISRDHVLITGADGLITISGGKWTTYRKMAEEAVDQAVATGKLSPAAPSGTENLELLGTPGWTPAFHAIIAQTYVVPHRPGAIDTQVAEYLSHTYGSKALEITKIAEERNLGQRLVRGQPMLEAEVIYTIHNEFAQTAVDFLANRTRLAFLDTAACRQAIPRVVQLMGDELKWSSSRRRVEVKAVEELLGTFCA